MTERLTLGIETSCDETAAAVFSSTRGLLSSVLYSQLEHQHYGGVVPEIASRAHSQKIQEIISRAVSQAQITLHDITLIAVTNRPGLAGSLLVGLCFAKALAYSLSIPLIGVNHLEGHAFSSFLEATPSFPHLCLTASGGHTSLYVIKDFGSYQVIGQTLDDAAGEAFDKIAKLLELEYPGGPIIERYAQAAHFEDFFDLPRGKKSLNFSFSGLKTAILYTLVNAQLYDMSTKKLSSAITYEFKTHIASSMLICVRDIFIDKLKQAYELYPHSKGITFVGGVACNKYLQQALAAFAQERNLAFASPSGKFCTDNAAMIALVGNYTAERKEFNDLSLDLYQ